MASKGLKRKYTFLARWAIFALFLLKLFNPNLDLFDLLCR
jgi:hypothetical protein